MCPTVPGTHASGMRKPSAVLPLVGCYLALCVLTLGAIVLLRDTPAVTDTVWVRGAVLAVVSVVTMLVAVRAVRDGGRALVRLRIVAAVQVVAIAVFVALPGALPTWMRLEQAACGIVLIAVLWASSGRRARTPAGRARP